MKIRLNVLLGFGLLVSPYAGFAWPELPFCPAGGPPGWMNYFDDKRDENRWRRQRHYASLYWRQHSPRYAHPPARAASNSRFMVDQRRPAARNTGIYRP